MYTIMRGGISYMRKCKYFRHDSNNQTATYIVNEGRTDHLDGEKLSGEAYIDTLAPRGIFYQRGTA